MKLSITVLVAMGFTTEEKRFTKWPCKKHAAKCLLKCFLSEVD